MNVTVSVGHRRHARAPSNRVTLHFPSRPSVLRDVIPQLRVCLDQQATVSDRHGATIWERAPTMSASFQDVGADLRRIKVSGRLDMEGTDSVSARLMELVEAPKKGVVIDLCGVRFLASVGIRVLIASAKAVQQRGGKLALVVARGSTVSMSLKPPASMNSYRCSRTEAKPKKKFSAELRNHFVASCSRPSDGRGNS